jgi:DNA-binding MarR family transcriptional regulator
MSKEPGNAPETARPAARLRIAVGRIARRLRQAHAVGELTLAEVSVLARLERQGPAAPGALAELERVRPQAMGTTLAALEERGLVQRAPDAADGRRVVISVTAAGRELIDDRRCASTQRIDRALSEEFTNAERAQLLDALPLLERLAERL